MEEPIVILQVTLHDNEGIEIRIGGGDKVNPLMLVGILEQVKSGILNDISSSKQDAVMDTTQSYDA